MLRPYRVPLYPVLPAAVLVMSIASAVIYGWSQDQTVLWLTAGLYGLGMAYYVCLARPEADSPQDRPASNGHPGGS